MAQEQDQNQNQASETAEAAPDTEQNITRLSQGDKQVILVGTAHVSKKSADLVREIIDREKPDTVCVELCQSRYQSLQNPEAWREMDIVQVIKEKRVYLLLSHLLLASFQKRIADRLGIQAGAEMVAAIDAAKESQALLVPVDREIRTTLARAWRLMSFWTKVKMLAELMVSFSDADEITEEDVEKLKQKDALELLLQEMGEALPQLRTVLIDERDKYLAQKIKDTPGKKIVAVVGAGHVPGMERNWDKEIDLLELEALPPKGKLLPFFKWAIPLGILGLLIAGFVVAGKNAGLEMAGWWVAANAAFAGLGACVALSHPLTILAAMAAAPFTSLNPMIGAGWVAGLLEAFLRKPQVKDLENLSTDILSVKGFWKNKATRILLVAAFTNLGSFVGGMVAIPLMARAFGLPQ